METDHAELSIDADFHELIDFIAKVVVENKALENLRRLKYSKQNYAIFETNMKKEDIVYMLRQCLSYVRSNCFVQLPDNKISFPKSVIMRFAKNIDEFNPIIQKKYKESIEKYTQKEDSSSNIRQNEEFIFCETDTESEDEEESTPQKYLLKLDLEIQKIQERVRSSLEQKRTAEEITETIQKEKEQVKKDYESLKIENQRTLKRNDTLEIENIRLNDQNNDLRREYSETKEKNSNLEKEVENLKEEIEIMKEVETLKKVVNTNKRKAETEIPIPSKRQRTPEEQRLIGQLMSCLGTASERVYNRFERIRSEVLFGVVNNRITVMDQDYFSISDTEGIKDVLYYLKNFAEEFINAGYVHAWIKISGNRSGESEKLRQIIRQRHDDTPPEPSVTPIQRASLNSVFRRLSNEGRDVAVPLGKV